MSDPETSQNRTTADNNQSNVDGNCTLASIELRVSLETDEGENVVLEGVEDEIEPTTKILVSVTDEDDKHSKDDMDDTQTASTRGSTTPVLESSSSSPVSEMSERSSFDMSEGTSSEASGIKGKRPSGNQVTCIRRLKYSREELLKLMDARASRLWPDYFDIAFKKPQGKIDLEKWMRAKQDLHSSANASGTTSTGIGNSGSNSAFMHHLEQHSNVEFKKSRDPRERIKDEQDGIVLSPQRRSFGTGCQVMPQMPSIFNNSHESGNMDRPRESIREMPVRRIGSGRILRREEQPDHRGMIDRRRENEWDMDSRRDRGDVDLRREHWRSKIDNRYDREDRHIDRRRRFFDEDEKRLERRDMRDTRRYQDHRKSSYCKEEEPEWFTGGPSSQNEYIELVGFDEPQNEEKEADLRPKERRRSKKERGGSAKSSRSNTPLEIQEESDLHGDKKVPEYCSDPIVVEPPCDNNQDDIQFNVEDYLGSILNIGSDDMFQGTETGGASRLKQFFKNPESPVECSNSRPSSAGKESFTQVGTLLGFNNPIVGMPSNATLDSNRFFAPISPAETASGGNIVQMLHQANSNKKVAPMQVVGSGRLPPPSLKDLLMDGRGQSLEDIEANLHKDQHQVHGSNERQPQSAFNPTKLHLLQGQISSHHLNTVNPFSEFLSQAQQKKVQSEKAERNCIIPKLLHDNRHQGGLVPSSSVMANKPALPNNAPTESELINRLMKTGNVNGSMPPMSSRNAPPRLQPPIPGLNILSHNISPTTPSNPPQQLSPSRSHFMPPPQQIPNASTNSDIFMKLMQQNQQKKQMMQGFQQPPPHNHPHHQVQPDPIKQLLGGLNSMSLNHGQQNMESQDSHVRDKIMHPDVQKLLQRIVSGQLTEGHLISQLNSGNLNMQQREIVTTVLKVLSSNQPSSNNLMPPRTTLTPSPTPQQNMLGSGLGLGTAPLSPRVASPNPDAANMLTPHMMQQTRLSPLICGSSGGPRRTPSHQELVVHTQSILQKALIKQELENAKKKHRKREAERIRSPNPAMSSMQNGPMMNSNMPVTAIGNNRANQDPSNLYFGQDLSPNKGLKCQSPLAFTPTSVMRKMTAEKDRVEKDFKPEPGFNPADIDKAREQLANRMQNPGQNVPFQQSRSLKVDKRMSTVPSPLPSASSMLGPRAQMVMSGAPQSNPLMNLGHSTHGGNPPPQRHVSFQQPQSMGMARPNQHTMNNIRALHQAQQAATMNHQMVRSQMPPHPQLGTPNSSSMQNRMANPPVNHMHQMVMGNNNNNYKFGDSGNLMNLFGRDVFAKVQQAGPLPELPGGKVLSLEEVERLQQPHSVPN